MRCHSTIRVVSIGCGEPKKSMGWFHLNQIMHDPRVKLHSIVEPWFLGAGKSSPGAKAFNKFADELRSIHPELKFYSSVEEMPLLSSNGQEEAPALALIAGRTSDAYTNFQAACAKGASFALLEKPGAETADQLSAMLQMAREQGVQTVMGYNKNVSEHMHAALSELVSLRKASTELPLVTLEHANLFAPGPELMEFIRGPGGEGMLHNMCCHELAIAATLFGVSSDGLATVSLDHEQSKLLEWGEGESDWQRIAFNITMKDKSTGTDTADSMALTQLRFVADRCGGNFSCVHLDKSDGTRKTFRAPTSQHEAWMVEEQAHDPEIRPYFLLQKPEYKRLKDIFFDHILQGKAGIPDGVVGLDGALEALRLADLLAPVLKECWRSGAPWVLSSQE